MWPSDRPMLTFLRIERPTSDTLRPRWEAASITCCTRWMFDAKLVTMIRPWARANTSCSCGPTPRSDGREPGPVGVGRVAAQQQHAVAAELGEPRDVGGQAVDGRLVELVVAGDDDRPELGAERYRARVGDRMGHVHELDLERAELELLSGPQVLERGVAQLVLVELRTRHRHRQPAAVHRRGVAELAQDPRQRAEMILVAVGDHDRLDVVDAIAQVGEVGQDQIDPEHVGGREPQAGVDDDDPVVVLDDRHVLADLAQAAQRQHPQRVAHARLACSSPWRSSNARITSSS